MRRAYTIWHLMRAATVPALAFIVIAFFGGYAVFGPNGVLAWNEYNQALQHSQAMLVESETEKRALENRVALLDPHHANRDLVDELARKKLGVADPNELVVPLHD